MTNKSYFEYIQATILQELDETNTCVIVAVSWLTDVVLYHKLYSLARKGKKVEILLNYDDINLSSGIDFEKIQEAGGKIYWEYESAKSLMHNKFCLIDNNTIITGSYNWTNRAKSNKENIIVIKEDYDNFSSFKNEFYRLINRSDLITTDTFSTIKYQNDSIPTYETFLEWWENSYIELRIGISESLFKRKYEFSRIPSEQDFKLLTSTTALDLEFVGNLLLSYKESIKQHFNDYNSLQAEYGYNLSRLNGIEQIKQLEYLDCSWNDIVDLEPLSYLLNLKYLDISYNGRIQSVLYDAEMDLNPLKSLKKLEYLNILGNRNIINFDALHYLKSLRTLDLSETNITEDEIEKLKFNLPDCEISINSILREEIDEDYLDDINSFDLDDDLPF